MSNVDHADSAVTRLLEAAQLEHDVARKTNVLRAGQIHATLALRDSVEELIVVFREVARAEWRARSPKGRDAA